jgi:hypothetical protein
LHVTLDAFSGRHAAQRATPSAKPSSSSDAALSARLTPREAFRVSRFAKTRHRANLEHEKSRGIRKRSTNRGREFRERGAVSKRQIADVGEAPRSSVA